MKKLILIFALLIANSNVFALRPFIELGVGGGMVPDAKLNEYYVAPGDVHQPPVGVASYNAASTLGGNIGAGVMLNHYFGIEAEYFKLGALNSTQSALPTANNGYISGVTDERSEASAQALSLLLDVPLPQNKAYYITGKAGLANLNIKRSFTECNKYKNEATCSSTITKNRDSNGLGMNLALGAGYHVTKSLDVQAMYNYLGAIKDGQNIQYGSVGLNYLF